MNKISIIVCFFVKETGGYVVFLLSETVEVYDWDYKERWVRS